MESPTLGIFISTPGRRSLLRTLWSIIYQQENVEDVLVVSDGYHQATEELCEMVRSLGWLPQLRYVATKKTRDWGHSQQNYALKNVRGDYILYQDDDDIFLPRALHEAREALKRQPGMPLICRVKTPFLGLLWQVPNEATLLDGHCMVIPNDKKKVGYFGSDYNGDQCFIHTSLRSWPEQWAWSDTVLTLTRPQWKLWPKNASQGVYTWLCDLHREVDGLCGPKVGQVFLEEDGDHYNVLYEGDFTVDEKREVIEFATWACQGKDAWFKVSKEDKDFIASLVLSNYKLHEETADEVEYTHDWPPEWWTPIPRIEHLTGPDGHHIKDWRDPY